MQVKAIGIAWYKRENYKELKALMVDADLLPTTFDKWQHAAEKGRKRLIEQGNIVVHAHLDTEQFPAWCRANGCDIDAEGRMAYANFIAHQTYLHSGGAD